MDIGNFFEKNLKQENNSKNNFISNFLSALQNSLENNNSKIEGHIFVVNDVNDDKLSVIDIDNGKEFDIFKSEMSENDFYSLNLGSRITVENGKYLPFTGEFEIKNKSVAAQLEDLFFCLDEERNATYSVTEISDDKIFLTNTQEGGHFSIPKQIYPDFKVGDLVKNENGKYVLI